MRVAFGPACRCWATHRWKMQSIRIKLNVLAQKPIAPVSQFGTYSPSFYPPAIGRFLCRGAVSYCVPLQKMEKENVYSTRKSMRSVGGVLEKSLLHNRGPPEKNFLVPPWHFFSGGYPQRGRGVRKKIYHENFFWAQKARRFLEIHPTPLNLEGANRTLFKVSTDILTDMGGICGLILVRPCLFSGCRSLWLHNPCPLGGPKVGGIAT